MSVSCHASFRKEEGWMTTKQKTHSTRMERKKHQKHQKQQQPKINALTKNYVRVAIGTKAMVWSIGEVLTNGEGWKQQVLEWLGNTWFL
jgi:hypothetical protein